MGWRIDYGSSKAPQGDRTSLRCGLLTLSFFLVFCVLVFILWPEGKEVIQAILIPGDPEITLDAAEAFAKELHQGTPVGQAARNFFITVLDYGSSSGY